MRMQREARRHETVAAMRAESGVRTEDYWAYRPQQRVMTCDGYPGRVQAVYDGFADQEYHVELDNGMGGGIYTEGQLQPLPSEASNEHTADKDYPELGTILEDRPDPAKIYTYAAKLANMPGQTELFHVPEHMRVAPPHTEPEPDEDENKPYCGDCGEEHGEDEGHRECAACGERHQDIESKDDHERAYTDWDEHYPRLGDTIHRGMEINLHSNDHADLHNKSIPASRRAHLLADHLARGQGLGMHWTQDEDQAKHYAGLGGSWKPYGESSHVVIHAQTPAREHIEEDPDTLVNHEVIGMGHHDDEEIPLRAGAPVHVTGLSWKQPHEAEWTHHTFAQPLTRHLAIRTATTINGEQVDDHGDAPSHGTENRAADPNAYDDRSTEGDPDPVINSPLSPADHQPYNGATVMAQPESIVPTAVVTAGDLVGQEAMIQRHLLESHGWGPNTVARVHERGDRLSDMHHAIHDAGLARHTHHDPYTSLDSTGALSEEQKAELMRRRKERQRQQDFEDSFGQPMEVMHGQDRKKDYAGGHARAIDPEDLELRTEEGVSQDVENAKRDQLPLHRLNGLDPAYRMIVECATDDDFRFHVTAHWRDVQTKAKRIRATGGVRITLASEGIVYGEVRGDHHTYETGVQRLPGDRHGVATYACGCKWGAYHWGADDDLSRFAGRMCSHALALHWEAQSRGMFGKQITPDTKKPGWVPDRIVVKYDIDDDANLMGRSSSADASPLEVFLRHAVQHDTREELAELLATAKIAAANDPFGGENTIIETPPKPYGATEPPNYQASPASAGPLTSADPKDWATIEGQPAMGIQGGLAAGTASDYNTFTPGLTNDPQGYAEGTEVARHPNWVANHSQLHDEPEGALPETDGYMDDSDTGVGGMDDEALSPDDVSIQPHGSHQYPTSDTETMPYGYDDLTEFREDHPEHDPRVANQVGGDDELLDEADVGEGTAPDDAMSAVGDANDVIAAFQRSAAGQALNSGADQSSGDIAAMAREHLAKQGMKQFTPAEQAELINEGGHGVRAANFDALQIEGTHYASLPEDEEDTWLAI